MNNEELQNRIEALEDQLRGNFLTSVLQTKDVKFTGHVNLVNRTALPAVCAIGELAVKNGILYTCSAANTWSVTSGRNVVSITTAASYTIDTNTYNALSITALAGTINTISSSGSPNNFDSLLIRILDNGTSQSILWDATKFIAKGVPLPSATTISKCLTIGFLYDSVVGKWGCLCVAQEA